MDTMNNNLGNAVKHKAYMLNSLKLLVVDYWIFEQKYDLFILRILLIDSTATSPDVVSTIYTDGTAAT